MSQSLAKIYVHIVFSTKNRNLWINKSIQKELYSYISGILKTINSPALVIGGMPDHCHILAMQSKNIATCKIIEEVKKSSSRWIKTKGNNFKSFQWQNGYGVFSVSQSQIEHLKQYIANQEQHHNYRSFQDEFRLLLRRYEIEYDEKYVWD